MSSATKTEHPRRTRFRVEIDSRLCKGCYICIRYCPAGVFAESDLIGEQGYDLAKVQEPEKCTGCRLCLLYCPDFAIATAQEGDDK